MSKNKNEGEGLPESQKMADNILVMDVEGTDGRERGEDQDFERKSALFALATSEVLIVNIWEHQVGLYQGANMGLLKTVFEVNLQLFLKDKQYGFTHRTLCDVVPNMSQIQSSVPTVLRYPRSYRYYPSCESSKYTYCRLSEHMEWPVKTCRLGEI